MLSPRDVSSFFAPGLFTEPSSHLAALVYEDGPAFDRFAYHLARDLRAKGYRLAGVAQINEVRQRPGRCDMVLEDLGTGRSILISDNRGTEARGCHLNSAALIEAGEIIRTQLQSPPDLLLINKFGKSETEGGGLRDVIADAFSMGLPTLIGVPHRNLDAWQDFTQSEADRLPLDPVVISHWLLNLTQA